jgi:thioesterase domain-containing protein/acyl carrier protein
MGTRSSQYDPGATQGLPNTITSQNFELLTRIWQEVLQQPAVSPDDNFFDLGGDSALAVQLFTKIAQTCGQRLPPVMIYHAPTIALQAELLKQPSTPKLSPLVLLKSGDQHPSVFIAPGLGGGPAEFFQLVNYIDLPHSIYGLQPKGIEGFDEPCARIEDMAEFYLQGIIHAQPRGPYIFAGYSLGGLVAIEMARRLMATDNNVSLVVLIDSYPGKDFLSRPQRLRLIAQKLKIRLSHLGRMPRSEIRLGGLPNRDAITTFAPAFERVRESAFLALRRYQPTFYPGAVKFIRAAQVTDFPEDPKAVWSNLVGKIEVATEPGDHLGMLATQYEGLAAVLNRHLKEAVHLK